MKSLYWYVIVLFLIESWFWNEVLINQDGSTYIPDQQRNGKANIDSIYFVF